MDIIKAYILSKPKAVEDYPFGADVMVAKIHNKMFATYTEKDAVAHINLKCEPQRALLMRSLFERIIPGYHMNKKHWNTLILDGSIPEYEVLSLIDHSYSLVVNQLTKVIQKQLTTEFGSDSVHGKTL